jgi:hypothetical protein
MRWMSGFVLGSSKRGSGRLGEACHMKEGAPNQKYFSRIFPSEGGVTSLGGRTTWGRGKEWKGINARMGVGMS